MCAAAMLRSAVCWNMALWCHAKGMFIKNKQRPYQEMWASRLGL